MYEEYHFSEVIGVSPPFFHLVSWTVWVTALGTGGVIWLLNQTLKRDVLCLLLLESIFCDSAVFAPFFDEEPGCHYRPGRYFESR